MKIFSTLTNLLIASVGIICGVLIVLAMTGCESDGLFPDLETNHGYGFGFDWESDSGMRVRADVPLPSGRSPADFEVWYFQAAACLGYDRASAPPPPMVIYVDTIEDRYGPDGSLEFRSVARYHWMPPLILIRHSPVDPDRMIERMRHESIHHITGLPDSDPDHGWPAVGVWLCRYG